MPWICALDFLGRLGGAARQLLHFGGDHGKAAPGLAGARSLDGGVERQQRSLPGDGLNELDDFLNAAGGQSEIAHGLVGARQLGRRALGGGARFDDLLRRIHHQHFDIARRGGDAGDILGGLRRGVRGLGDLLRHVPVALAKIGGGAPYAFAGAGEGVDHFFHRAAEIAGEEQPAGVMQARLGLAAELVDGQRIGLDQRGAHGFRGTGELLDGAVADQVGQRGVAVAAGDAVDRGEDVGEAGFGEGADEGRADQADHQRGGEAGLQAGCDRYADDEGRYRNPQRGAGKSHSAWRSHLRLAARFPQSNSPEDGFKFLSQLRKTRIK